MRAAHGKLLCKCYHIVRFFQARPAAKKTSACGQTPEPFVEHGAVTRRHAHYPKARSSYHEVTWKRRGRLPRLHQHDGSQKLPRQWKSCLGRKVSATHRPNFKPVCGYKEGQCWSGHSLEWRGGIFRRTMSRADDRSYLSKAKEGRKGMEGMEGGQNTKITWFVANRDHHMPQAVHGTWSTNERRSSGYTAGYPVPERSARVY